MNVSLGQRSKVNHRSREPSEGRGIWETGSAMETLTSPTKPCVSLRRNRWVIAHAWNHALHNAGPMIADLISRHMLAEGLGREWSGELTPSDAMFL